MDFSVYKNKKIKIKFIYGMQRVSPFNVASKVIKEDIFVVNKARGASIYSSSEGEVRMCLVVAKKVIKNLADDYEKCKVG